MKNRVFTILIAAMFLSASVASAQYTGQTSIQYTNAQQSQVTSTQLATAQAQAMAQTIPPPPLPNYSQCSGSQNYSACTMQLDNQYQQNLATYNQAKAQAAAQAAAQQQQYDSAKQAALDAQKQNQAGQKKYDISQLLTMAASIAAAAKFAASCSTVCQPAWLALSIAMAMFSNQAGQQSNTHAQSQYQSCTLANQLSTSQANCGSPPGTFNFAGYPNNGPIDPAKIVDTSGTCIAGPEICSQIATGLPAGTDLKDFQKGLSAFASGQSPYKVNPDGSITDLKSGKTFTPDNFKDAQSMAAAGMSAADIAATTNMLKGLGNGLDAKKELNVANGNGSLSGFGDDASGKNGNGSLGQSTANGALDKDAADAAKKRSLASAEGLSKDFNGELIGVSGDDIFKMMNRRYRLKDSQDSFLGIRP
jgi:hypothetical protein